LQKRRLAMAAEMEAKRGIVFPETTTIAKDVEKLTTAIEKRRNKPGATTTVRTVSRNDAIDEIVRMMVEGRWCGGRSAQELAAQWGCHPRTVQDYSTAAGAALDRMGTPLEEFVTEQIARLDGL
jgi:hypothetical protein